MVILINYYFVNTFQNITVIVEKNAISPFQLISTYQQRTSNVTNRADQTYRHLDAKQRITVWTINNLVHTLLY